MKADRLFTPLTAIFLSLLMYFSSLSFGFNLDDNIALEHPAVQSQSFISAFTLPYHNAPDNSQSYGYRPVSTLSFVLQNTVLGSSAGPGHLINLALFCLIVWRLFAWSKHWLPQLDPKATWFFIALFAVHPLHVETVVSIKNRDELLALLFAIEAGLQMGVLAAKWSRRNLAMLTLYSTLALGSKLSAFPTLAALALAAPVLLSFSSLQSLLIAACLGLPGLWLGYDPMSYLAFTLGPAAMTLLGLSTRDPWKQAWSLRGSSPLSGLAYNLLGTSTFAAYLAYDNALYLLASVALFSLTHLGRLYAIGAIFVASAWVGDQSQHHMWALAYWAWAGISSPDSRSKKILFFALLGTTISLGLQTQNFNNFLYAIPLIAYVVVGQYKPKWIPLFLACTAVISMAFNYQSAVAWLAILHLLYWAATQGKPALAPRVYPAIYIALGLTFCLIGNLHIPTHWYQQQTAHTSTEQAKPLLSEGRSLERIENPLSAGSPIMERWATAANTMGHYSQSFLYPLNLRFYYGLGVFQKGSWKEYRTWIFAILHLILALCIFMFWKRKPILSFGLTLYLGGILLFSNAFVWVAGVAGDRLVFQASLGACLAIAAAIPKWNSIHIKLVGLLLGLALIVGFQRVQLWKDPLTLMRHDTQLDPASGQGHYLFAMALMQQAQTESPEASLNLKREAQSHFQVALSVDSLYWNARIDLSRSLAETGDFEECLQQLLNAKDQKPDNEVVWRELCLVYYDLKRAESCLQAASRYLELHGNPDENIMEIQAFLTYSFQSRDEGMQLAKNALQHFPNNPNLAAIVQGIMPPAQAQ